MNILEGKQVWLADDSAGGGKLSPLYSWYKQQSEEGKLATWLMEQKAG